MKLHKVFVFTVSFCIMQILAMYYFRMLNKYSNIKKEIFEQKLVCIILTTENSFANRGIISWKTWARKCDKTLFA